MVLILMEPLGNRAISMTYSDLNFNASNLVRVQIAYTSTWLVIYSYLTSIGHYLATRLLNRKTFEFSVTG